MFIDLVFYVTLGWALVVRLGTALLFVYRKGDHFVVVNEARLDFLIVLLLRLLVRYHFGSLLDFVVELIEAHVVVDAVTLVRAKFSMYLSLKAAYLSIVVQWSVENLVGVIKLSDL
jgi:hypothetical protein